jgi:tRNA threonylcarbamoyladenosine biosynthesis protein TsaB
MRILAFDTSTSATTTALFDPEAAIDLEQRHDPAPGARPGHASKLMGQVIALMQRASTSWGEIDRLAVGIGPGTFTGLRIGVATARALACARAIPLVGIPSLEALALGARRAGVHDGARIAAIDARRGEAFAAAWDDAGERLFEDAALGPDQLARLVREVGKRPLAIGTGALEFRALLEREGALVPPDDSELHLVSAANHCRLALDRPAGPIGDVKPAYLRLADAEIALRARENRPTTP